MDSVTVTALPASVKKDRDSLLRFLQNQRHAKARQKTLEGLLFAIELQKPEYISEILRSRKVDPNTKVDGKTPLAFAVSNYYIHPEVVQALLDGGADPKNAIAEAVNPTIKAMLI